MSCGTCTGGGSHALVFNTMLHWNDLRTGWPERLEEDEEEEEGLLGK